MKLILLILFFVIGCTKKEKEQPTPAQVEFVKTFTLEEVIEFESCNKSFSSSYCAEKIAIARKPQQCLPQNSSGPGLGTIAVGTALGMGAVKLLFGK